MLKENISHNLLHESGYLETAEYSDHKSLPASAAWRSSSAIRGRRNDINGFRAENLQDQFDLYHASSFAIHNVNNVGKQIQGHIAVGNTTKTRDVISIIKPPDNPDDINDKHKIVGTIKRSHVTDISWLGSKLMCATSDGCVYLYNIDMARSFDAHTHLMGGEEESKVVEYSHTELRKAVPIPPVPGRMMQSTKIHRVSINPKDRNLFITLENLNLHIWDVEQTKEPILSKKAFKAPSFAAAWNPHTGKTLMVGGISRSLKLYDVALFDADDQKPVIWKHPDAHKGPIRDIQWNPFVPHWVATAGEDAVINLWDLRFGSHPLVSLEDHYNCVNRICWSPTHCDMLLSGASDRQLKLWNLNVQPHFVIATHSSSFNSSVIGVGFSRLDPYSCYGLSSGGEFVAAYLTEAFLEPMIPSRCGPDQEEERQVEKEIFFRDFGSGFQKACLLAGKLKSQNRIKDALAILELCYERTPPDPNATPKTFLNSYTKTPMGASKVDMMEVFQSELSQYSYYIPPNFPEEFCTPADAALMQRIEHMKLNLELLQFIEGKNVEELLEREQDIYDTLKCGRDTIPISVLRSVLQIIQPHNYLKALEMAEEVGEIIYLNGSWSDFIPIARMLFFPTIFEPVDSSAPTSPALVNSLIDQENVMEQLVFLRKFTELLWNKKDDAKGIISMVEKQKPKNGVILSATIQKAYLSALLHENYYYKFFNAVTESSKQGHGEFLLALESLKKEGLIKLEEFVISSHDKKGEKMSVSKQKAAVIELTGVLFKCQLPVQTMNDLTELLGDLTTSLETSLTHLVKKQSLSGTPGNVKAAKEAKKILSHLDGLTVPSEYQEHVSTLTKTLKKFVT